MNKTLKKILPVFLIIVIPVFSIFLQNRLSNTKQNYKEARLSMVKYQIEARGINDKKVLAAMKKVGRHLLVPKEYRSMAYTDRPLPIGFGQTNPQPYIVALMTELLCLKNNSLVLEVGTGSGYHAAVLAEIVKQVYTVEIVPELARRSAKDLKKLGYKNIEVGHFDGYYGWEKHAPYDAIVVTAAAEFIPPPLIKELKVGGVMCIPVGPPFSTQTLYVVKKKARKKIETKAIAQVRFVPLTRRKR